MQQPAVRLKFMRAENKATLGRHFPGSFPAPRHYLPLSGGESVASHRVLFNPQTTMALRICLSMLVPLMAPFAVVAETPTSFREEGVGRLDALCEAGLFNDHVPTFQNGDVVPAEGIFGVALQPAGRIVYLGRPPGRTETGYGGIVTFDSLAVGRYAIVLSQPARLEAIHHEPFQPVPVAVRMEGLVCTQPAELLVEGGAVTLQFGEVATPVIMVAVIRLRNYPPG